MELASCEVRLGNDMLNTVYKELMTPAELIVLRSIHGQDAVVKIRIHAMNKRPHAKEVQRLRDIYDRPTENVLIVSALFPGANPSVPVTFKEIGIQEDETADNDDTEEPIDEAEEIVITKAARHKYKKQPLAEVLDLSAFDPEKDA